MVLLQPTDIPSMDGINDAITSEIAEHSNVPADPTSPHYDSGWLPLTGTPDPNLNLPIREYRIKMGMVQIRFSGTIVNPISVSNTGNFTDQFVGQLPVGARPGGGGINSSTPVAVELAGHIIFALVYNGGAVQLAYADSRNVGYTSGAPGSTIVCISPLFTINS